MNHRYEMEKYCDIMAKWRNMMFLLKLTIHSHRDRLYGPTIMGV